MTGKGGKRRGRCRHTDSTRWTILHDPTFNTWCWCGAIYNQEFVKWVEPESRATATPRRKAKP